MLLWSFTIVNSIVKKKTYFSLLSAVVVDFPLYSSFRRNPTGLTALIFSYHYTQLLQGPGYCPGPSMRTPTK